MKTHRFEDLVRKKLGDETYARIGREVRKRLAKEKAAELDLSLRAVRELAGKTQAEVADLARMAQSEISKVERREDRLISTIRHYIEALGGELEVIARFGDKTIRLHGV
jgi:hypothetical protein